MKRIRTVAGDIRPDDLGITLIHEHPFFDMAQGWDDDHRIVDFDAQVKELGLFQNQGGNCIVDQTNIGMGRKPYLIKRLAETTGLNIIAGTGYYREPWFPDIVRQADINGLAEIMVNEIEHGIEKGEYKAGLIGEIGSTEFGTTILEEKVLRAAGRAQLATGLAISTHTMGGAEALRQIQILKEEGVDPGRVIISHIDLDHFEHLRMVAGQGVFLGFDTIGKKSYRDDEIRLKLLLAVIEAGFEDQVVLSHDISRASYLFSQGGHGYQHLLGEFIPRLSQWITKATIDKFLIDNPRRVLAF